MSGRARRLGGPALALALALAGGAGGLGCQDFNTPIYVAAASAIDVSGTDAMGNAAVGTGAVVLRFRQPSQMEQQALDQDSASRNLKVPWLQRDRIHLELLYTVTNLDDTAGTFTLAVDGASELVKYDENVVAAAFQTAGDKPVFVPLIQPIPQTVGPKQYYQGTVREDDFVEAELDLDAMGRWMAPFAAVLINRSDVSPIGLENVPANVVIPAMQEVDLTLSSPTKNHLTCQFMLRVRDDDDRLLHESSDRLFVPTPVLFMPVIPPKT